MSLHGILNHIKTCPCPQCKVVGGLDVLDKHFYVFCRNCQAKNLNPFAIGPWDKDTPAYDKFNGEVISVYRVSKATSEEVAFDEKWGEFFRHYYKGSNLRDLTVKAGGTTDESVGSDHDVASVATGCKGDSRVGS